MKNWKYINGAEVGNAFDFETQAVVDRKEAVKTAEEELRKAEAERNKHRGERYWEEVYIAAKKGLERAKENLARAQRNKARNSNVGNAKDKNGKELRTGDDVSIKTDNPKLNKGTVVRINGETVEVQVWGTGGSVWTTPSRLVTKVGNAWTAQKEKRLDELARKGPSKMTRQEWEEFLRLEKESSLENQKFVKSLSKNSKTGNDSLTTSIEKGRLGLYNWYVHKNGSIVAGGTTDTESEAKLEAEKALKREKANNKVGNELNTGDFFKRLAADAHKEETRDNEKLNEIGNAKEINITGRKGSGVVVRMNNIFFASFSLENGEKGIEKFNTESEAVKFLKTKVGNSKSIYPWDQNKWREIVKDPSGYSKDVVEAAKRSLYMLEHKGRAPEDDKKVGNFQTGKSKFKVGDRVRSYGVEGTVKKIEGENTDNIYGEPLVEVEFDSGRTAKIGEHYLVKVGNSSHNLFLRFPSIEEAEDYISTKLKTKYKDVKIISKPHNGSGLYEIMATD